jgi:hydrogenase maturation protease
MTAVVIGYGNTLRGDDGAGPAAAEAVAELELPGVRVLAVQQLTPELAECIAGARMAVFVDASAEQAERVTVESAPPRQGAETLGHVSDPGALLALAWALHGASPPAWLVRVPVTSFQFGESLSARASRGVTEAARAIARLLQEFGITRSPFSSLAGNPPAGACRSDDTGPAG